MRKIGMIAPLPPREEKPKPKREKGGKKTEGEDA